MSGTKSSKGGKGNKAGRYQRKPCNKTYSTRKPKNKERKKRKHEKRLARFKSRCEVTAKKREFKAAKRLLDRVENKQIDTSHVPDETFQKAKKIYMKGLVSA